MRKIHWLGLTLSAALGLSATAAQAVEVRQEADVAAPQVAVWKRFGAFCAIKDWHPALAGCEQTRSPQGTFRTLTLKDGGKIRERLTSSDARSYAYTIEESPLPVKNYSARLVVTPGTDDKSSKLVWTAKFDAAGKSDAEAKSVIDGIFTSGLKSIVDAVKADADKAAAARAERLSKYEAAKKAAKEKYEAAKAATKEKLAKAKEKAAEKAAQAKLVAAEKLAKAKAALAEQAHKASEAAKQAYEKAKAAYENAKSGGNAPAKN